MEVVRVVGRCIEAANRDNVGQTSVDKPAERMLIEFSEGYPHFIQQFGYSAFEANTDGIISGKDVFDGALGPGGALERIGDRYYRDDFYRKIQKDSYRQVLRIMADNLENWINKKEIREKFKGKDSTLDNAIHALRSRHIILTKEETRGVYRLQHRAFAHWIKIYTQEPKDIQASLGLADANPRDS